jgi:poly-gamma-glutamate synthesis protein (capsule biosynthesis protein)
MLYDLGDFLDDYRVDPGLRNDLGFLFLVDLAEGEPRRLEAVPLKLEYCFTRLADAEEAAWMRRRFRKLCADLGTQVVETDGRVVIDWA